MGTTLQPEKCKRCGHMGYDHRRIGLLVDGHLVAETSLCRAEAVDVIKDATNIVEHGNPTPFAR